MGYANESYVSKYDFGLLSLSLGDRDRAFEYFLKAYEDRSVFSPFISVDARLDPVRSDARFGELVCRMDFPRQ